MRRFVASGSAIATALAQRMEDIVHANTVAVGGRVRVGWLGPAANVSAHIMVVVVVKYRSKQK